MRIMISSLSPNNSHASSLSPLSSRFAAEAERENIRRLRLECRGLSAAIKSLKRNSKEWVSLKSRLDIASEELACMLEDRNLFRSFTGGSSNESMLNVEIPTPPVGSPEKVVGKNGAPLSSFIPTPPLVSKKQLTARDDVDEANNTNYVAAIPEPPLAVGNPNAPPKSKVYEGTLILDQTENGENHQESHNVEDALRQVPKYSLEWFQMKMESGLDLKEGNNDNIIPNNTPPPPRRAPVVSSAPDQSESHNVKDALRQVPKYSLEWFQVKIDSKEGKNDNTRSTNTPPPPRRAPVVSSAPDQSKRSGSSKNHLSLRNRTSAPKESKVNVSNKGIADAAHNVQTKCRDVKQNKGGSDGPIHSKDLAAKLENIPKYSLEWFTIKKEITAIESDDQYNHEVDVDACSKPAGDLGHDQGAKLRRESQTASIHSRPKDSIYKQKEIWEREMHNLTEQLDGLLKYSLDWFQVKQYIEALERLRQHRNGSKQSLNMSRKPMPKNGKPEKIATNGQTSPRANTKSKTNVKMARWREVSLLD